MATQPLPRHPTRGYASQRWSHAVKAILLASKDIKTLQAWSRETGVSIGALQTWCRAAGVPPKNSLDFGRLLRIVLRRNKGDPWRPFEMLDIVDQRTMRRLLRSGGLDDITAGQKLTPDAYIERQMFVRDPVLLAEIAAIIKDEI